MSDQINELKIEEIAEGSGDEAPSGATVKVHYTGSLMDGTKFDSSHDRGEPAVFPLNNLIPGMRDGIAGMKVGGERKITVPHALGYGERGVPPNIPPRADLVFEVELLGIE